MSFNILSKSAQRREALATGLKFTIDSDFVFIALLLSYYKLFCHSYGCYTQVMWNFIRRISFVNHTTCSFRASTAVARSMHNVLGIRLV